MNGSVTQTQGPEHQSGALMTKKPKLVPHLKGTLRWDGSCVLYRPTYHANKGEPAILPHREWLRYSLAKGTRDLKGPLHDAEVWVKGKDMDEYIDGSICEEKCCCPRPRFPS